MKTCVGRNDPLPSVYTNRPYQYMKFDNFVVLRKRSYEIYRLDPIDQIYLLDNNEPYFVVEKYLFGSDKTQFIKDCNRAKQKGRSLSDVIGEYFIN
jgi:hypothetical protein